MAKKLYDNRKTVRLANGLTFLIPPWHIAEREGSVMIRFPSNDRVFAKWYVTIID